MSSFTPGPWKAEIYNDTLIWVIHAPNQRRKGKDTLIARMYGRDVKQAANARLIAASPELLELVRDMLPEEREVYEHTLKCDTPDEAEPYKEIIDRADALLRRIEEEETE